METGRIHVEDTTISAAAHGVPAAPRLARTGDGRRAPKAAQRLTAMCAATRVRAIFPAAMD